MKKDIIFFANNLVMGGIEKSLINLLNRINYQKYNVTLVLEKKEGVLLDKINKEVKIVDYNLCTSKNVIMRKIINYIKRTKWIKKNKNKYQFSCCYATYSLIGNILAKAASKNNAIYIHSDYTKLYDQEGLDKFFKPRKINEFKHIIFVSNEAKDNLIKYDKEIENKSIVINNFIDNKSIITLAKEKVHEEKPLNTKLFVFVGRLEEESKRITALLELFKNLSNKYDINLWLIGDGPDKDKYINIIKENKLDNIVKLLGQKNNPYPYIDIADYLIMTSKYEGFPVTYLEAICLGTKIITTINVSDDNISVDQYGHIISSNIDEMTKEVSTILDDDKLVYKSLNFDDVYATKMEKFEKIIDGVV